MLDFRSGVARGEPYSRRFALYARQALRGFEGLWSAIFVGF